MIYHKHPVSQIIEIQEKDLSIEDGIKGMYLSIVMVPEHLYERFRASPLYAIIKPCLYCPTFPDGRIIVFKPEPIPETKKLGQVFFYAPDYQTKTIKMIGMSQVLNYMDALNLYADTPNPASQIIEFNDEPERLQAKAELDRLTKDPEWLEDLFNQI